MDSDSILKVENLSVIYQSRRGPVRAVREVSFDLKKGENLALIGESGCGKTTLGLALIRLLSKSARIVQGKILYRQGDRIIDVLSLSDDEVRRFRWQECAMVFQAALNAFNPVIRIWDHIYETAKSHGWTNRNEVREEALELFRMVQLDPHRVIDAYPHELSGGHAPAGADRDEPLAQTPDPHPRRADDGARHLDAADDHRALAPAQRGVPLFDDLYLARPGPGG